MEQPATEKGLARPAAAGLGLGGVVVAGLSRAPWVQVSYADDRVGGGVRTLSGSQWSTEVTAVALLLVAAAVAVLVVRRLPRRIIGAIAAVAAAGAALSPLAALLRGADPERARALLTAGSQDIVMQSESLSAMAQVTAAEVNVVNVSLVLVGLMVAAAGGVAVALRPGADSAKSNKYETDAVRRERIGSDLEENPDSGRVLWDALDADIDPTDPSGPNGATGGPGASSRGR